MKTPDLSHVAHAQEGPIPWNTDTVRHLFNRAAFGLPPREVQRWLQRDHGEAVEFLLAQRERPDPYFMRYTLPAKYRDLKPEDKGEELDLRYKFYAIDKIQLQNYADRWIRWMLEHVDPLRDRMTLFWQGLFTNGYEVIARPSHLQIRQHRFVRENAVGNYGVLLRGIVRQPATLCYLDNNESRSGHPNENLARELMELFSLGEGAYTEHDVKEAARALTGYTVSPDRRQDFFFNEEWHDDGVKTILGETGAFDGDDLVEILLRQEACQLWISGRIITYLEGLPPSPERQAEYAAFLREHDYELQPFLRKLLSDPAFYREEVVAQRVTGPVDFLVGGCRRLGADPPHLYLAIAATVLGMDLFEPPSVKGWDEGPAWVTTSSLIDRGNVFGLLLGVIDSEVGSSILAGGGMAGASAGGMAQMSPGRGASESPAITKRVPEYLQELATTMRPGYMPDVNLSWRILQHGARTDEQVAGALLEELLAIRAPETARRAVAMMLREVRERYAVTEDQLLGDSDLLEETLRNLAHVVLCLPEAQLH